MAATPAAHAHGAAPPAPPGSADVPAWRLLGTLGAAGALAGLLIVLVFGVTLPTIQANKARALAAAIDEVLKAPERYETLYVLDGRLTAQLPPGVDGRRLERVYLGYRGGRERVGFAIAAGEPGFQDMIRLIFGYDAATRRILGMKVLESKETPGLGDKIEKDEAFVAQFGRAQAPLVAARPREGKADDPHRIQIITGATISSRAVVRMINASLERLGPLLEAYREDGTR